jgi:hypothetical protein
VPARVFGGGRQRRPTVCVFDDLNYTGSYRLTILVNPEPEISTARPPWDPKRSCVLLG